MKKIFLILILGFAVTACTVTKPLYNWSGYDDAVYAYTKNSSEQSISNLVKIYTKLIDNSGGSRNVPPPGVCADYGYILIQKGEITKGKELLVKETILYPESKPFIDRILKRFEK